MLRRIAYLASQYPAASHTFIRREVHALRARGVEVHTFSIRPPSESERRSPSDQQEFESTWYVLPVRAELLTAQWRTLARRPAAYLSTLREAFRHRVPGAKAAVWALFHFAEGMALAGELERRNIEHLHNHFANAGANVGYLAAHYLGIDWSVTLHGISEFDYPAGLLLPAKIRAAKFVACVSHFGRAQAMRITEPAHWGKMFISRCGVELGTFPKVERPAVSSSRLRLVSVGRLSPEKGQIGLLIAFARLIEQGNDVELRIVGDGPERANVEAEIKKLGLESRCTLVGRLPELQTLEEIAAADIFVLTSFMEGLPVVLMEALGMRVPVVAPCVAGIPELVEHRKTGLLFSPGNWTELAERLRELCASPTLREQFGQEGRRRVEEEFDVVKAVLPVLQAFGIGSTRWVTPAAAEFHAEFPAARPPG